LRVSKEVGGNLSEPLQVLAETLRRKAILEGRIQALTAQGRIQGLVMTLFPLLLMGVLYLMQPTMGLLFSTTIGWVVLTVIAAMLLLGYAMIRKIVAIDI
jgi:tight adherence protein B